MRGGFFISLDEDLYQQLVASLVRLGGRASPADQTAQLTDVEGRLFTLEDTTPGEAEWEYRDGPFLAGPGVQIPDMQRITACLFSCRWTNMVVQLAQIMASSTRGPLWLLDGDGVVWNAAAVDPVAVTL